VATDVLLPLQSWLGPNGCPSRFSANEQREEVSNGRQGRKKTQSTLPPELRGSMTSEVEQQLRELIRQHGAQEVYDALVPRIAKCKLNDRLCVANAVERLARKMF
jgi:hypothetical protein